MAVDPRRKQKAKVLRQVRRIHRYSGLALFVFFVVVGITSVLLGWKKNVEWIMPPTQRAATAVELADWLPQAELATRAQVALREALGTATDDRVDRLDGRPGKGVVKVLFKTGNYEVQLDAGTGEVLSLGKRRADLIEQIHDGSIVDEWVGTSGAPIKVFYSTVLGLALVVFSATGFWLWYGPRRM